MSCVDIHAHLPPVVVVGVNPVVTVQPLVEHVPPVTELHETPVDETFSVAFNGLYPSNVTCIWCDPSARSIVLVSMFGGVGVGVGVVGFTHAPFSHTYPAGHDE